MSSTRLVLIHPVVGLPQQHLEGMALGWIDGIPDADSDRDGLVLGDSEWNTGDRVFQIDDSPCRLRAIAFGKHYHELVAAITSAEIIGPYEALERARDVAERPIAGLMAPAVVD